MGGSEEPKYFSPLSASGGVLGRGCTSLALCPCLDRHLMILPSSLVDSAPELWELHSLPLFLQPRRTAAAAVVLIFGWLLSLFSHLCNPLYA